MRSSTLKGPNSKSRTLINFTVVLCALLLLAPFGWLVLSSLKPQAEIFAWPPRFWPSHLSLEHYRYALTSTKMWLYFLNSLIVAALVVVGNVVVAIPTGYAFAHLRFKYRDALFLAVLAGMMVPSQATVIPLFIIARHFPLIGGNNLLGTGGTGLLNTYLGLALPNLVLAFVVFLSRQFFSELSGELREAAKIDGASEGQVFWRIYMPVALPLTATVTIFSFITAWDDFLWPLIVSTSEQTRTLQVGLSVFLTQGSTNWGPLLAATVLATLPIVILFITNQRAFVSGLTTGSSK